MKTMLRTLAVLMAALTIAGLTYTFGQSSTAQALFPERHRPAQVENGSAATALDSDQASDAANTTSQVASIEEHDEHEHDRGPSLFGVIEVVKNLVIIGIIIGIVHFATRGRRGRRAKMASR